MPKDTIKQKKEIFRCYIKTLTPVHIGCDEVYEPTGFVVDENNTQIVAFNPIDFISGLSPEDKMLFSGICRKGTISSILEIYKFMRNRSADGNAVGVCKDFITHYQKTLSMSVTNEKQIQRDLNNFVIPRTSFCTMDQRPYIPGSGIKGALRTAYLNYLDSKKNIGQQRNDNELQKTLLSHIDIKDDPFRMVKVTDFMPVGEVKTKVIYAVNEKKKISEKSPQGNPQMFEVVQPGTVFQGMISVEMPLQGSGIKNPIIFKDLLDSLAIFFGKEKMREDSELKLIGINSIPVPESKDSVLLRCGRHSGAESITVEGHRKIRIKLDGKNSTTKNHATTFWLASEQKKSNSGNLLPFGWMHLNKIDSEKEEELRTIENKWLGEKEIKKLEKIAVKKEMLAKKKMDIEEKQKKEEEERKKVEEDARKQEKLEAMNPEQRMIFELDGSTIAEEDVVKIYAKLDEISEKNKVKIASGLKKFYEKEGKWEVNKKKKKQWDKIQKIKAALGEI